jgi:hypothetical protein
MTEDATEQQRLNICPTCGEQNPPGTLMCRNCSALLSDHKAGVTYKLDMEESQVIEGGDRADAPVAEGDQPSKFVAGSTFAIKIREADDPMVYQAKPEKTLLVGRRNDKDAFIPDVDLYPFAGFLLGVSRKHALIYPQDDRLMIEDLGSRNGTYVAGERLKPNTPQALHDGVRVSLGKLHFTIHY